VLSSPRELGAAMVLLDLLRRAGKEEGWRQFDKTIQTFVGRTDSATSDDLPTLPRRPTFNRLLISRPMTT